MSLRAAMTGGGDGATAVASSVTFTLPASAMAGDAAVIGCSLNVNTSTLTTPTGWSLLSGPDDQGTNMRAYLFGKILDAGDITAGTVTVTASGSIKWNGAGAVFSGVASFGVPAVATVAGTDASIATATITTAAVGSDVISVCSYRKAATPIGVVSWSAGLTEDVEATTANTSGVNTGVSIAHLTTPGAAGTYGGDVATFSNSEVAVAYTVELVATATAAQGTGAGSTAWLGAGVGQALMAGTAAGVIAWAGVASGSAVYSGSSTGATTYVGAGTGQATYLGTASGATAWLGAATGTQQPSGAATGATGYVGTASGSTASNGSGAGVTAWVGAASGTAPAVGSRSGSAVGVVSWSGAATGQAPTVGVNSGAASGTVTWTGTAAGSRIAQGDASSIITWTGTASGSATGTAPEPRDISVRALPITVDWITSPVGTTWTAGVTTGNATVAGPVLVGVTAGPVTSGITAGPVYTEES